MEGNDYIVSWCVGHLIELAQPKSYDEFLQKWTYESLPIIPDAWQHEVKSDTKAQYRVLYQFMHDDRVESVVCATDVGREVELIFRLGRLCQADAASMDFFDGGKCHQRGIFQSQTEK